MKEQRRCCIYCKAKYCKPTHVNRSVNRKDICGELPNGVATTREDHRFGPLTTNHRMYVIILYQQQIKCDDMAKACRLTTRQLIRFLIIQCTLPLAELTIEGHVALTHVSLSGSIGTVNSG